MGSTIRRFFLISGLLLMFWPKGYADLVEESLLLQIECYQEVDSFEQYFVALKNLSRHYKSFPDRFDRLITKFNEFKVYREPKTREESVLVRGYYASLIYALNRRRKNVYAVLKVALEAHDYAWDKESLDHYAWYIENEIGHLYAKLKNFDDALRFYKMAELQIKESGHHEYLSRVKLNMGKVYLWSRDTSKATEYVYDAFEIANVYNNRIARLAALERICELELGKGNYERFNVFLDAFKKQLSIETEDPNLQSRKVHALVMEGDYNMAKGNYHESLDNYEKALELFKSIHTHGNIVSIPMLQIKMARAYSQEKEFRHAMFLLEKGIQYFENIRKPDNILVALYETKADLHLSMNKELTLADLDSAYHYINKAIRLNERIKEYIIYSNSAKMPAHDTRKMVEKAIAILYKKERIQPTANFYDEMKKQFDLSKDLFVSVRRTFRNRLNRLDHTRRKEVDELISQYLNILSNLDIKDDYLKSLTFDLKKQIAAILGLGNTNDSDRITEDYIQFIYGRNLIYLYARFGDKPFFQILDKKSTTSLVYTANTLLREPSDEAKLKKYLKRLGTRLIPDELELPEKFTVIPDGPLSTVPFDILVGKNNTYLVYDHIINVQTSSFEIRHKKIDTKVSVLCHIPKYEEENGSYAVTRSHAYHLPFAESEFEYIKETFPHSSKVESVVFDSLNGEITKTTIYHYTGHTNISEDSISMHLGSNFKKPLLTSDRILNQSLNIPLVILGGCETGLNTFHHGGGNSLARAFEAAGAGSVISSLWPVNDASTSILMKKIYQNLAYGLSKDEALRKAKLDFIADESATMRHPYYWAGFVIQGDSSPIIYCTDDNMLLILLNVGIIGMFILMYYKVLKI